MPFAWAYGILLVIVGAATELFAASAMVYLQKATPEAQRGHALSAFNAGFMGFVPAGSFVVVAGLAAAGGTRWALIVPGAAIVICGAAALTAAETGSSRHRACERRLYGPSACRAREESETRMTCAGA